MVRLLPAENREDSFTTRHDARSISFPIGRRLMSATTNMSSEQDCSMMPKGSQSLDSAAKVSFSGDWPCDRHHRKQL
jgi:hypothetical protein